MDVLDAIHKRRSRRGFSRKPIETATLVEISEAGRWAPTARGEEPVEMIVVTNPGTLQELGKIAPNGSFLAVSSAAIVVISRPAKYYLEDGCAATTTILLAATAREIASCWVAGDKKPYCSRILKLLKAPADYKLVSIIALGYPVGEEPEGVRRRPLEEILHRQQFGTAEGT